MIDRTTNQGKLLKNSHWSKIAISGALVTAFSFPLLFSSASAGIEGTGFTVKAIETKGGLSSEAGIPPVPPPPPAKANFVFNIQSEGCETTPSINLNGIGAGATLTSPSGAVTTPTPQIFGIELLEDGVWTLEGTFKSLNGTKCVTDVLEWGDTKTTDLSYAFAFSNMLTSVDAPASTIENLRYTFAYSTFNGDLSQWETKNVTSMGYTFFGAKEFDQDLPWDTSSVIDMDGTFNEASKFNKDISRWKTDSVVSMQGMFFEAYKFNQNISKWNTSNVTNMRQMFYRATDFNQPIGKWEVRKVANMEEMFAQSSFTPSAFKQDLSNWKACLIPSKPSQFDDYAGAPSFNPAHYPQWNICA